jgi:NAD-dependent deacetylase
VAVLPPLADSEEALALARSTIHESRSVVALTGAGISTDSGIRDFRGPAGLWTLTPQTRERLTLEAYLGDPELRRRGWASRRSAPAWNARPNDGHLALVELERQGKLDLVITQNADGLHRAVGHREEAVLELHGSIHRTDCLSCHKVIATSEVLERVSAGEDDPRCEEIVDGLRCDGILKVATVSFGQPVGEDALRKAVIAVRHCDVLLVIGSTLRVDPVAGLVPLAVEEGVAVVIVNQAPTRYDHLADIVVSGSISDVLPRIVAPA